MTEETTAAVGPPTTDAHPTRIFVGLKTAPEIANELARIARELEGLDVRLVAANDIHLTLVPPWNEVSIPDAINKLRPVAARFDAFSLMIQHVGYGPDPRRPRLLWADCAASFHNQGPR
jgi:2'-5' RNA ligase